MGDGNSSRRTDHLPRSGRPAVGAEERQHTDEAVTDDCGAQVPDVHLLGDVRRRVVDDGAPTLLGRVDAQAPAGETCGHLLPHRSVGHDEVQKARASESARVRETLSSARQVQQRICDSVKEAAADALVAAITELRA